MTNAQEEIGALAKLLAQTVVNMPGEVKVTPRPFPASLTVLIRCHPKDMGHLVGSGGRTARAISACLRTAGELRGIKVAVPEFQEPEVTAVPYEKSRATDFGAAFRSAVEACVEYPQDCSGWVMDFDAESKVTTLEVRLGSLEREDLAEELGLWLETVFKAASKRTGGYVNVSVTKN